MRNNRDDYQLHRHLGESQRFVPRRPGLRKPSYTWPLVLSIVLLVVTVWRMLTL